MNRVRDLIALVFEHFDCMALLFNIGEIFSQGNQLVCRFPQGCSLAFKQVIKDLVLWYQKFAKAHNKPTGSQ